MNEVLIFANICNDVVCKFLVVKLAKLVKEQGEYVMENLKSGKRSGVTEELNMYDEWQELYDEISAEIKLGTFTETELFHHCLKTCNKIFSRCEFRYGQKAKNIPEDFIEDISIMYEEKRDVCASENMKTGKYDYATSCENFPKEKFSISDLAKVIFRDEATQNIDYARNMMWQLQNKYLKKFFGVKEIHKGANSAEVYEILRLLKILQDCKDECGVDLGCLLHLSLMHQNNNLPSAYTNALNFIKERILGRYSDSNYRLDFKVMMELEKYNNSLRSFLNYFSDEIITQALKIIKKPKSTCKFTRWLCEIIYTTVIDIFKVLPAKTTSVIDDAKAIQAYAYEHFLMSDINNPDYAKFYSKIFQVEASDTFYEKLEQFLKNNSVTTIKITDIENFVERYKKDLLEIIYPEAITDKERRRYLTRILRHKEYYGILGRIYNCGMNRPVSENLQGFETVALIYLYEFIADKSIDVPLYSGYTQQARRRDLKINQLIKKIQAKATGVSVSVSLTEEEYFLACYWLNEQMYTLTHYRTIEIQQLREKMKSTLLAYWTATIPFLTNQEKSVNPLEYIIFVAVSQIFELISKKG